MKLIKAKDVKPKHVFVESGFTYIAMKISQVDQSIEIEVNMMAGFRGTGLIILHPDSPVLILGELA